MTCKSFFSVITVCALVTFGHLALAQDETGRDLRKANKKAPAKPAKKAPAPRPTPTPSPGAALTIAAPPGAIVDFNNGRLRNQVGSDGTLVLSPLPPGEHLLSVQAEGYEPWSGKVTVARPGANFTVPLKKKILLSKLAIFSSEPDAEIFLDDKPLGLKSTAGQPISLDSIQPGQHQLRAVKPGFKEWRNTAELAPGQALTVKIELRPILDPEMVRVPAGEFTMGNDKGLKDARPAHAVSLAEFEISKSEITNRLYKHFLDVTRHPAPLAAGGAVGGWESGSYPAGQDDRPVTNVSWEDAVAFCRWLSEQTGSRYRLPTEAEWEKAARSVSAEYASAGNVWEWVADWYDPDYYKRKERSNPTGPPRARRVKAAGREGEMRVLRGGAFGKDALPLRAAERNSFIPSQGRFDIGFRVVREIKE